MLNNLGTALRREQRFEEAITAYRDAANIFRATADRNREGKALNNLAIALSEVQEFDDAVTAYQKAARIFRDTGDHQNEELALRNLQETRQAQNSQTGA
jgi:tetratricopeptide (TPR) repeat protein